MVSQQWNLAGECAVKKTAPPTRDTRPLDGTPKCVALAQARHGIDRPARPNGQPSSQPGHGRHEEVHAKPGCDPPRGSKAIVIGFPLRRT